MTAPVREKGYQSRHSWWAAPVDDEETPELRWPLSVDIYDAMRRQDPQVASVLWAVMAPIRLTPWRVDGEGCKSRVTQLVAEDLGLPIVGKPVRPATRTRDRFSWDEHLRLALLMLPFGHAFFEQIYRPVPDATGRIQLRLRKLAYRPPRTISGVEVADDGGLIGLRQYDMAVDDMIEVNRLVAYVNNREGGNWLGQSLLRPAYKNWLLKDRALRTQSITLDRNGLGVPIYEGSEIHESIKGADRLAAQTAELVEGAALASSFRGGEDVGAAIAHGAKLTLKGVDGDLPDADKPIRYHDEQIARAVLANFLSLGGDNSTGSYALGETFAEFFTQTLGTVAKSIAETASQHIVEDIVDLNFGTDEPSPRIVCDEITAPLSAQALQLLVDCNVITADAPLEQHVRTRMMLPPHDMTTARAPVPAKPDPQEAA
jgi:hypothetical protein